MIHFQKESFPEDQTLSLEWSNLSYVKALSTLSLKGLILDNNRIHELHAEELPPGLTHLSLRLNGISMSGLPTQPLRNLKTLLLQNNEFYHISSHIGDIVPNLETLNVQTNYIDSTAFISSLSNLKHFNAKENDIRILEKLPSTLETLQVSDCKITLVQSRLPSSLQVAYLSRNKLRFGGLPLYWGTALRYLDLSRNKIEKFPRKLPDSLEHLNLSHNRIDTIPLVLPASLKTLHLGHNHIREVPSNMGGHVIDLLFVSNNHITHEIKSHVRWTKVIYDGGNWNESHHHIAQKIIRRCWKATILRKRARNYARSRRLREELITVAMQPSRAFQIEYIQPIWFLMQSDHNRIDHLKD